MDTGVNGNRPNPLQATINADGTFTFAQVLPGTYLIRFGPIPIPIEPIAITVRDRDVDDVEIRILPK